MTTKHLLAASFIVLAAIQTAEANGFSRGASRSRLSRPVYHSETQPTPTRETAAIERVTVTVRCGATSPLETAQAA